MINIEYDQAQLLKQLNELERGLQGKLIRKALTPAVKPIAEAMKALVPTDYGSLKKSLGVSKLSDRAVRRLGIQSINAEKVVILLGSVRKVSHEINGKTVRKSQGYKAIWAEYGTSGKTAHKAIPFLAPALTRGEGDMQHRFFQGLQKAINRI